MKRIANWLTGLAAATLLVTAGCTDYGKVDQGRVIKYDKDKGVVTMIRDKANDTQSPDYTYLPPLTYEIPKDPNEMGPEPKAGGRMKIDAKKSQVTIFDPASQNFKTIEVKIIEDLDNVGKDNPLVFDKDSGKARKFPDVDKDKKTVKIYSGRQKKLITFSMAAEYFAMPDSTWDSGDEIRVYYKEDGKALRMMNITKTDIFKK